MTRKSHTHKTTGFALIEIFLILGILSIILAVVIFIIDPNRQLAKTRNAQRKADLNTILSAVYQYKNDHGSFPKSIPLAPAEICKTQGKCRGLVNLENLTENKKYLDKIPEDPNINTLNGTGYTIFRTTLKQITISAPGAENNQTISITR